MINSKKLLALLAKRFPKRLAQKYHDFVGLMCGSLPLNISKIYLALDMEELILEDVIKNKPDVLFTHHPFYYFFLNIPH